MDHAVAVADAVHVDRRPGGHVADDDEDDAQEILEEILIPHVHAMSLARLEVREDSEMQMEG